MTGPSAFKIASIALYSALILATGGHALLNKRDPRAAWGWIAVCFLFPVVGAVLYLLFGINRVETRAQRLGIKSSRDIAASCSANEHMTDRGVQSQLPANLRALAQTAAGLTGLPLLPGNTVEVLHNGEAAYPRMLAAIDAASESIALATYIFDTDELGCRFIDSLSRAVKRGVRVRCLLDGLGEYYSWTHASTLLKRAGVPVARFNPPQLLPPSIHINLRNHRKLLMVDGRVAFTGGMNISQRHMAADGGNPHRVSDLHFELRGVVIGQLQRAFAEDWRYAAAESWPCPPLNTTEDGTSICRAITDGPNEDLDHLLLVLLAAISAAQRRVAIMTPYFLPSTDLVTALQAAALRGVDTSIILPGKSDNRPVHWASQHVFVPLLERGVRIYRQPPPFAHTKLFLIDDCYTQIGSANIDPRSLRLNFELTVETYDSAFNSKLSEHFAQLRATSREILYETAAARSVALRLRDALCWLFSPYL
jgi:cardiolipin synthase